MKQGSGPIHISTGQVSSGLSGNLALETGSASLDKGGSGTIKIQSGTSGDERRHRGYNPYSHSYGDLAQYEGGSIELISGTNYNGKGGTLNLTAGGGSDRGGNLNLTAGTGFSEAIGGDSLISGGSSGTEGGSIFLQGGEAREGGGNANLLGGETSGNGKPGGNVKVESGRSMNGLGEVVITSAGTDSSSSAASGETILSSGSASNRVSSSSGVIRVTSGESVTIWLERRRCDAVFASIPLWFRANI